MRRILLVLPVLALVAPLLSSCGEDEADAAELIRNAPEAMAEAGTVHLEMSTEVGDESIDASGGFDLAERRGALTVELPTGSSADVVLDDGIMFMSTSGFGPVGEELGADWIRIDAQAVAEVSGIDLDQVLSNGATNDPTQALDSLQGISEDGIEDLGTDEVRGVSTTHYRAAIDMAAALDEAAPVVDEDLAEQFLDTYGNDPVPVEVWIDDDGLTRKMTMEVPGPGGEEGSMEIEMFDHGEPVDVQIPDERDTIDYLDLFGSFLPDN